MKHQSKKKKRLRKYYLLEYPLSKEFLDSPIKVGDKNVVMKVENKKDVFVDCDYFDTIYDI